MAKEGIFISLVIPAYNESKVISDTINKTSAYFAKKNYDFEIIVVNDDSIDNTRELVSALTKNASFIKLINNKHNMGKGFSVKCGVLASRGDYILFSDADLSTPIEDLDKLMPYFAQGYDVVIGSRALKDSKILLKQPGLRQSMGKIFNLIVRLLGLATISDTQCGFKCFTRDAARKIFELQRYKGFCFDVEILYLAKFLGYRIKDIPVTWTNRIDSRVGIIKDSLKMFFDLFKIKADILRRLYNAV